LALPTREVDSANSGWNVWDHGGAPEGVSEKKYDETAPSMIALLRYGNRVPWYRLQGFVGPDAPAARARLHVGPNITKHLLSPALPHSGVPILRAAMSERKLALKI